MIYRSLKTGALALMVILFIVLSNAVRQDTQPVMSNMSDDSRYMSMSVLAKSIGMINTIEYKMYIKTSGSQNNSAEIHIYYRRPAYLRVETKCQDNMSIDIYNPSGMYEYFPKSSTAYYREKWRDNKPVSFQLEDKLQDMKISGKYEYLRMEKAAGINCEVVRSVDEEAGNVCEHRVWLGTIDNLKLPVKEVYLTDGENVMNCEYEYVSINREIQNSLFELKSSDNLKIFNAEGIPKTVKDEKEAEKYAQFNVVLPQYTPEGFSIIEICVIPPLKKPAVLITYMSDINTIFLSEKKADHDEPETTENSRIIKEGQRKFIIEEQFNDSIAVKWVRNGIEFEVSGSYTLKDEIERLVMSVSGVKIQIE